MQTHPRSSVLLALGAGLAGALMSAVLTLGLQAWANHDDDPATDGVPRAFSYNGSLEWDGVALNGPVEMTFRLFGAPDAAPEAALWSETQRLTAYSGKFGAELGADPANPVTDTLYDAGPLWLGVSVQRLDDGGAPLGQPITLDNKQKINPVPYALWSTQSSNLNVAGTTTTGGLQVTGGASVNALTVTGGLRSEAGASFSGGEGQPALTLAHGPGSGFGAMRDFQVLLEDNTTPTNSIGLGVEQTGGTEPNVMSLKTKDHFRFYTSEQSAELRVGASSVNFSKPVYNVAGTRPLSAIVGISDTYEAAITHHFGNNSSTIIIPAAAVPPSRSLCALVQVQSFGSATECNLSLATGPNGVPTQWLLTAASTTGTPLPVTPDERQTCRARCIIWD